MAEMMYWQAIRRAHDEELARDPMVIAMGEDIGVLGGTYKATQGLFEKYGPERVYLGGPGVSISGDDAIAIALEARGGVIKPKLVAAEAAGLVAMQMLEHDSILTIGAVAMPGSAPAVRLMMYPDGPRLGVERIVASIERGIDRLSVVIDDVDAARKQLLGI